MFDLIGNERVKGYLKQMVDSERIGNALLFSGPSGIGKRLFAEQLARHLTSPHDIHHYRPEGRGGVHSIASLRALSKEVVLVPNVGPLKVFIIEEADRMLTYSANALLKTFEEPPLDTLIILVSSRPQHLLPTIHSRCRAVHFAPIPTDQIVDYLAARGLHTQNALWARGSLGRALRDDPVREELFALLASNPDYDTFTASLAHIADTLEKERKATESDLRKLLGFSEMANQVEKEIEGMATLAFVERMEELLEDVMFWFKEKEGLHRMPQIEAAVKTARNGIIRYSKVSNALEGMFLSIARS